MIEFFPSVIEANVWLSLHPEWKPVSVSAGHMAGSILVLFEAKAENRIVGVPGELAETYAFESPDNPVPKRRGRPPKVKVA